MNKFNRYNKSDHYHNKKKLFHGIDMNTLN